MKKNLKMTNKEYQEMQLEEMKRYLNNWSYMSAQQKRDIGCNKKELQRRIRKVEKLLNA